MERAFWIVAAVGIALVAWDGLDHRHTSKDSYLVMGMKPQTDMIRQVAQEENWSVTCEGRSGEMIVLRLSPGFFASSDSATKLMDRPEFVPTTAYRLTKAEAELPTCDVEPQRSTGGEAESVNPALVFGTREILEPYLGVARSCGFEGAEILPIREDDIARYQDGFPSDWLAIYPGPISSDRNEPAVCFHLMSRQLRDSETGN